VSHASVCVWYSKFSKGNEEALNLLHAHVHPAALCDVNICGIKELILGNRRITMHDISCDSDIRVGSLETIMDEHMFFKNVFAWWIPKMLIFDQKVQHVAVLARHLNQFEFEESTFLE
jgi:hypothetical protein